MKEARLVLLAARHFCESKITLICALYAVHGPRDESVNNAVEKLIKKHGIPVVVSAGNWGRCARLL